MDYSKKNYSTKKRDYLDKKVASFFWCFTTNFVTSWVRKKHYGKVTI